MKDNFAHKAADWDNPSKVDMTKRFLTALLEKIKPLKSWKTLEIGAGTGLVGIELLPYVASVLFEDTSEAMLNVLKSKLNTNENASIVLGKLTEIKEQNFNFVVSCMAFHHIPDMSETAQHLYKITSPGAILAIGDIRSEDGSFHHFEPIPHKGFDPEKLTEIFVDNGFEMLSLTDYNILSRERSPGIASEYTQFLLLLRRNA